MRRRRTTLPGRFKPLRMGPPRVVEDCELLHIVSAFDDPKDTAEDLMAHVQSWCKPWEDWQLGVIARRAQLYLGCIRKELGRRTHLDPNQLRLLKGM